MAWVAAAILFGVLWGVLMTVVDRILDDEPWMPNLAINVGLGVVVLGPLIYWPLRRADRRRQSKDHLDAGPSELTRAPDTVVNALAVYDLIPGRRRSRHTANDD